MNRSTPAYKKILLMEQFISILIIFRMQLYDINIYIYYLLLLGFVVGKYFREGNTLGSILQYGAILMLIGSDISQIEILAHIGIVIAVLNYMFVAPTLYTLPDFSPKVALRDNYSKQKNNKQFYWAEWYPVSQEQKNQEYEIAWNHTMEVQKMAKYMKFNNKLLISAFKFFTSSTYKYRLILAKGTPGKHRGTILFSHGRGATPFLYSSILRAFARDWKIFSPQHSQVNDTGLKDLKDIKKYREIQVKQRGEEIVNLAHRVGEKEEIVLMGHSYGCSTVLQAYHSMPLSIRKRVSHIILLDPWLFPLTDEVFNDELVCPTLILANQHFLDLKDVYERNRKFVSRHKPQLIYHCWQGGDHLHQTDMAFVVGSSLRQIKNSKQCWAMIQRNIQAIQMFFQFDRISFENEQRFKYRFGQFDLGIDYKPMVWRTKFTN